MKVLSTAQELRAELDARAVYGKRIFDAMMRGDLEGCNRAQAAMLAAFPEKTITVRRAS